MYEALNYQNKQADYQLFFVDNNDKIVSDAVETTFYSGKTVNISFTLNSSLSFNSICYLVIRSSSDADDLILSKIPFKISMTFTADFGF